MRHLPTFLSATLTLILLACSSATQAQVAVTPDGTPPHASAMLEIKSTEKGLLIPRMTTAQRTIIASPATGLLVFDETTGSFWFYGGSAWEELVANAPDRLSDADGDTHVQVEESPDEDIIRFDLAGEERMVLRQNTGLIPRLEMYGPGGNMAIGDSAATLLPATTVDNTFIGQKSGAQASGGYGNTAIGRESLRQVTTGLNNTAAGNRALMRNTSGQRSTAVGAHALTNNTSGHQNTGIGAYTLSNNQTGNSNVAIGFQAMENTSIASQATAIGVNAMRRVDQPAGDIIYNTAIGFSALEGTYNQNESIGTHNSAIGHSAMKHIRSGSSNTAIGVSALNQNSYGNGNTAMGQDVLWENRGNHQSTAIGFQSMQFADNRTTGRTTFNTAVGYQALRGSTTPANNTGQYNSAVGHSALLGIMSGHSNTGVGADALRANTVGIENTAIGRSALRLNLIGNFNTAVGFGALEINVASLNTGVGHHALNNNSTGEDNAGFGLRALFDNTTGNQRTGLGVSANSLGTAYNNSTGVGYNADCTAANQVRVGNNAVTSIGGFANWTNVSDSRFKTNVAENVPGLAFINQLRPVTYNINVRAIDDFFADHYGERNESQTGAIEKEQISYSGFIAQEVEQTAQSIGYAFSGVDAPKNPDDFYGLRYAEFVVPLVKAVQEQQDVIERQQADIDRLLTALESVQAELQEMRNAYTRQD